MKLYKNNYSNRTSLPVYQKRGYGIITHWTSSHSAVNKPRQRTHALYDQLAIPENTADQLCCRYWLWCGSAQPRPDGLCRYSIARWILGYLVLAGLHLIAPCRLPEQNHCDEGALPCKQNKRDWFSKVYLTYSYQVELYLTMVACNIKKWFTQVNVGLSLSFPLA